MKSETRWSMNLDTMLGLDDDEMPYEDAEKRSCSAEAQNSEGARASLSVLQPWVQKETSLSK